MKSRKGIELILRHSADRLPAELPTAIAPYRAGYTPAQRQEIQRRLTDGDLLGVVATDALELGIDIGELDAAICVTFPGTVASLRQMWGRAGRRSEGLAVYIAGEDALDQFFCRHPDEFIDRAVEAAILDPRNPQILGPSISSAPRTRPRSPCSTATTSARTGATAPRRSPTPASCASGASGFVPARADDYPAARVGLRSASADSFVLVDAASGEMIGTVEAARAYNEIHEGAVYLHLGRSYLVQALDLRARRALLAPFGGRYFTQTKREIDDLHPAPASNGARAPA